MCYRLLIALGCLATATSARAGLVLPASVNGSDGPLTTAVNSGTKTINLSQAITGSCDQDNSADAGKGVYDPAKWAVVFKYSSVNIASGSTITFANHGSRAPVVWLVNGDVTITGIVNLNGANYDGTVPSEPGPGGFRGGEGSLGPTQPASGGFGPGGGYFPNSTGVYDATPSPVSGSAPVYGNARILPLIGGSGGSYSSGGGAGGGAILIAATGTITVNGAIRARGGSTSYISGSGGAIKLIADIVTGSGTLDASSHDPSWGGKGRIRIEANTIPTSSTLNIAPEPSKQLPPDDPVLLWPPDNAPTARAFFRRQCACSGPDTTKELCRPGTRRRGPGIHQCLSYSSHHRDEKHQSSHQCGDAENDTAVWECDSRGSQFHKWRHDVRALGCHRDPPSGLHGVPGPSRSETIRGNRYESASIFAFLPVRFHRLAVIDRRTGPGRIARISVSNFSPSLRSSPRYPASSAYQM